MYQLPANEGMETTARTYILKLASNVNSWVAMHTSRFQHHVTAALGEDYPVQ